VEIKDKNERRNVLQFRVVEFFYKFVACDSAYVIGLDAYVLQVYIYIYIYIYTECQGIFALLCVYTHRIVKYFRRAVQIFKSFLSLI
jgi:hypothetical protein